MPEDGRRPPDDSAFEQYPQDLYSPSEYPVEELPSESALTDDPAVDDSPPKPRQHVKLVVSPFQRLARVHALATATDAVVAVVLAGSIFFSISPDAARGRVALYLALTMAPFAVVTPLIGPIIDQMPGGRRAMILVTTGGRAVVALLMIDHVDTLWLFPEAFTLLVLQKSYAVAKSAVVPHYVPTESDLVQANSRLALLSAVMSLVGAGFGAILVWVGNASWAAGVAVLGYLFATLVTRQLPVVPAVPRKTESSESWALRNVTILSAVSAMTVLRGAVGFVTFLLAFELRRGTEGLDVSGLGAAVGAATVAARDVDIGAHVDFVVGDPSAPPWHFGVVAAAAGLCAFFGVRLAPLLRQRMNEETILLGALGTGFGTSVVAALSGGLRGQVLLASGVALASAAGKLAFDSLVQRDAPDANHGRWFSRFEARFQIAWVVGAFVPVMVPVLVPVPARLGELVVAGGLGFVLLSILLVRHSNRWLLGRSKP